MTGTASEEEEAAGGAHPTIFVSDPSAEAERIAQALRATGYAVVDVPMSMLMARVAVQRPRVILVDSDAEGALDAIARLRKLPDAEGIDVVFLGNAGAALQGSEDALSHEGSGFFTRPVDVPALIRKIEALTGGALHDVAPARTSTPPPSLPSPSRQPGASLPPAGIRDSGSGRPSSPGSVRFGWDSSPPPPSPSGAPQGLPPLSTAAAGPSPLPPAGGRATLSPETAPQTSGPTSAADRRTVSIKTPLSTELEALLAEAERRVGAQLTQDSVPPTPEEEIEAVLPAEILSALDGPLEDEDEDMLNELAERNALMDSPPMTGTGQHITTAGRDEAKTHGGGHAMPTTGMRSQAGVDTSPREGAHSATAQPPEASQAPPTEYGEAPPAEERANSAGPFPPFDSVSARGGSAGAFAPFESAGGPPAMFSTLGSALQTNTTGVEAMMAPRAGVMPQLPQRSQKAESVPPPAAAPSVFGPGEAPLLLARSIATRATGALCFEAQEGVRRAVLREGDLVTASSGFDSESLLAFLGSRGDLPRERVEEQTGKIPPFGRHAGAALVAHGDLRQDQLWSVLRAHAEWILGHAILATRGTAVIEHEPPGRLKNEPSVFGGSTGAEVFVEVVRRVIAPEEAIERLGGASSRIGDGDNGALLSECALDANERDLIPRMRGCTISEVVEAAQGADFASVLYALALLGVVDIIRGVGPRAAHDVDDGSVDAIDEDAIRARVRARMQLVEEGDYFAVLGLGHDATGYEVRRAFLELRRTFEPSRILSPQIADLSDDVRKIASVLDEAYEILRDGSRRERYRRAIDASPS